MNETPAPPPAPSWEALLRYSVLGQVEALLLGEWPVMEAVREVAGREHAHPGGRSVRVSVRTIQRWRAAYGAAGMAALEPRSRKRTETSVALFFLDDATRFGLDVVVGTSESTVLFLGGLYDLVTKHGLPDLLYLDRGPGFISADTLVVVEGGLGAWLIHGRRRYPQGHGVLERFNRTAHEQVLRSLDGAAHVDPAPGALTLRLRHFLDRYNTTPHETLDGDTPRQRWEQGRALRFPDDEADLYRRFVVRELHKVSADHVIKARGRLWEAPRGSSSQGPPRPAPARPWRSASWSPASPRSATRSAT